MAIDPKQMASIHRAAQRANARNGNGDEKLSLFIRVAESRIYNGKPVLKALLKEVVYLRMTDLHDQDLRIPKGTPWKDYEGWCYAKQKYLAGRVGCEPKYANQALLQIIEDGYLKCRKYRDKRGKLHKEYFPDEAAIDAAISLHGTINDEEPVVINTIASRDNQDSPIVINTTDSIDNHDSLSCLSSQPIVINTNKVCLKGVSEVCSSGECVSTNLSIAPSASPQGECVAALSNPNQKEKTKTKATPYRVSSMEAKTKAKPGPTPCRECGSPDPFHSAGFDCPPKAKAACAFEYEEPE